jgi:hypothetical protein
MRQLCIACFVVTSLLLTTLTATAQPASPAASPVASPAAEDGCAGLEAYFLGLADLVREDPALALLRAVGFDALALTADEAAAVVSDLDLLIPRVAALDVPAAASAYHTAYLAMLTWYRDLSAHRDPASHQRLINNDRHLFGDVGLGVQQGQAACGVERWNAAYDQAFPA